MNPQLPLDLTAAMERAERGIESSAAHADNVEAGWRYQALAMLTAYSKEIRRPFLIEEARAWATERGLPTPPTAKSWGAVARLAAAKGRIKKAGFGSAASSNCSPKVKWEAITQ